MVSLFHHPCRTIGCVVKTVVVVRGVVRDVGAVVVHVEGRTVDVLCGVKNSLAVFSNLEYYII